MKNRAFFWLCAAGALLLAGCGTQPIAPSPAHLLKRPAPPGRIPPPVKQTTVLPPPEPRPKMETYSVVVNDVPVKELLFALARDAKLNVDIDPGIQGAVTLNAIHQTLPQLLARIANQVDLRYTVDGPNLVVRQDKPYLKIYKVNYLNMSRDTTSNVSIATQIATAGAGNVSGGASGGGSASNNSTTSVTDISNNRFWQTLVQNIQEILGKASTPAPASTATTPSAPPAATPTSGGAAAPATPPPSPAQGGDAASVVIANPETGILAVRATARQHRKIQRFLDHVLASAKRQVLIEATIVEVQLSDKYQQGINWSALSRGGSGFQLTQAPFPSNAALPSQTPTGNAATAPATGLFALTYAAPNFRFGSLSATIHLLESFGKVKVLSSPQVSVLNNQTALLKVVDNQVYFTITSQTTPATTTSAALTTYTSELHTVPIGFVMSVTPQIAGDGEVTLNVRPTISRIINYVADPNPALRVAPDGSPLQNPVNSYVPVIQAREMESVIKVASGQTAIMGGLMQDSLNNNDDAVPGLSKLPLIGKAFSYRNDSNTKTELVIFLRPLVIKEASLNGDYRNTGITPPGKDFFDNTGGDGKTQP
ncbi:MAG TPA: pilus (MSHA type) biogenesis protein MshL [Betaproteobacteria bacterium]|nr:pilus (MSHA type) biogenesis protein MshL [Betaproteobacteria bacterium]